MKDIKELCAEVRQIGSYKFELRKFAWSHDGARHKSKPSFLFSALSAFSAMQ